MPPPAARQRRVVDYLALMEPWPDSWAGVDEDEPIGRDLVTVMRPFMMHLVQRNFSRRTLRRHLDNLWLIGGEIIRKLNYEPRLRSKSASDLLLDAIADGGAPFVHNFNEAEQEVVDVTARKLLRFLSASDHSAR